MEKYFFRFVIMIVPVLAFTLCFSGLVTPQELYKSSIDDGKPHITTFGTHQNKYDVMVSNNLGLQSAAGFSENEVLFDGGDVEIGFMLGSVIKYTSICDEAAWLVGLRTALLFDRSFTVGAGGYSLATDIHAPSEVRRIHRRSNMEMEMTYGGMELEYIYRPYKLAHFSFYSLIGAGNIGYGDEGASEEEDDFDKKDAVFVIEPAVHSTVNVTRWFGISAGISYRIITDFQLAGVDEKDMSGFSGILSFMFGKF